MISFAIGVKVTRDDAAERQTVQHRGDISRCGTLPGRRALRTGSDTRCRGVRKTVYRVVCEGLRAPYTGRKKANHHQTVLYHASLRIQSHLSVSRCAPMKQRHKRRRGRQKRLRAQLPIRGACWQRLTGEVQPNLQLPDAPP